MPSINVDFLKLLKDDYTQYSCFVETGTSYGGTIFAMEPHFNQLHTVEFSKKYYDLAKNRYNGNKINFILGDSAIVFETLLPTIQKKTIFFLDGHYSSCDTGQSTKDCPLDEEVTHIHQLFTNEAILIIDDFRLFGVDKSNNKYGCREDWSQINKENLLSILQSRIHKVYHLDSECEKDDRLIIHINAK